MRIYPTYYIVNIYDYMNIFTMNQGLCGFMNRRHADACGCMLRPRHDVAISR